MAEMISDIGNVRSVNEDYVDMDRTKDYGLYVVCDGVGGHKAGEVASQEAGRFIKEYLRAHYNRNIAPHILEAAIQGANERVFQLGQAYEEYSGMGTTVTCALDVGSDVFVAHAGDSSAYLMKGERIAKLTKDHSVVQQLHDEGQISEEEMRHHEMKNIITRSLGTHKDLKVDILEVEKNQFDQMILCTDGLTDYVRKEEMMIERQKIKDDRQYLERLVGLAKARGGHDNISAVIFKGEAR
ncbi:Protein serine/threonine phosphatase PrpC, regulation of stationary phase [Clostridiaceae bacterium JG1575]|nr:Protein serine/threonine phosphatase PrpC, regulation of stationary phase [Clostridiaceae bacterium JG1575]